MKTTHKISKGKLTYKAIRHFKSEITDLELCIHFKSEDYVLRPT
jgi:hypothetical protein